MTNVQVDKWFARARSPIAAVSAITQFGAHGSFPPKAAITLLTRKRGSFLLYRALPEGWAAAGKFASTRKVRAPRNDGAG